MNDVESGRAVKHARVRSKQYLVFVFFTFSSGDYNPCKIGAAPAELHSLLTRTLLSADKLKNLANDRYRDGKHDEAHRCYSLAIDIYPDEAKYYRNRGLNYEKLNERELAEADYRKSLEFDPFSVRACFSLGSLLHRTGKFYEAADFLQKALDYGDEPRMASDESEKIRTILAEAREKIEEIEIEKQKQRLEKLLAYLKSLVVKDIEAKLTRTESEDASEKLHTLLATYLEELESVFKDERPPLPLPGNVIPDYLCDKISHDMIKTAVITPSGVTYDETQIMRHLAEHDFDPVSRGYLRPEHLRRNNLLQAHIDSFMRKYGLNSRTVGQYICDAR